LNSSCADVSCKQAQLLLSSTPAHKTCPATPPAG
jgi:hypothetical protein